MSFYLQSSFLLLFLFAINVSPSKAQGSNIWSEPVLLFETDDLHAIRRPTIVSDSYGNVHVFWTVSSKTEGESDLIYYMRLDSAGWTTPVDIIASTPARAVNATVGLDDFIYLTWYGSGGILYSRSPIRGAEFVKNWSKPVFVTEANTNASMTTSPSGNVYLVYPGVANSGVFEQFFDPTTLNWSAPKNIALSSLVNTAADFVQMTIGSNGTMHVVWTEFYLPEAWPPRGVFYARSSDGGKTWSAPQMLAAGDFDQISIALQDDNYIHVAWNGRAGVGGRYHSWSSDGGQTWSEVIETIQAGLGGTEGPPQLVSDQLDVLHMLTTYEGCAWYTFFLNQRWASPVCISGEIGRASNYIEEPALALSEGNKLHAVFFDDEKRLWYTTNIIDAPWIAPQKLSIETIQPEESPTPVQKPLTTPTAKPISSPIVGFPDTATKFSFNSGQILILSLLPVLLLIILVTVISHYNKGS